MTVSLWEFLVIPQIFLDLNLVSNVRNTDTVGKEIQHQVNTQIIIDCVDCNIKRDKEGLYGENDLSVYPPSNIKTAFTCKWITYEGG